MASVQDRLKIRRENVDTWSTREQLCLASSVLKSGDQNWISVSRSLKPFAEKEALRPSDWFSQKSCAIQYALLLENADTPKRKKRESGETTGESIVKRLTQERIAELGQILAFQRDEYQQLKNEVNLLKSGAISDDKIQKMWLAIEQEEKEQEQKAKAHSMWLAKRQHKQDLSSTSSTMSSIPKKSMDNNSNEAQESSSTDTSIIEQEDVDKKVQRTQSTLLTNLLKSPSPTTTAQLQNSSAQVTSPTIATLLGTNTKLINNQASSGVTQQLHQLVSCSMPCSAASERPSAGAPTLSMLLALPANLSKGILPTLPSTTSQSTSVDSVSTSRLVKTINQNCVTTNADIPGDESMVQIIDHIDGVIGKDNKIADVMDKDEINEIIGDIEELIKEEITRSPQTSQQAPAVEAAAPPPVVIETMPILQENPTQHERQHDGRNVDEAISLSNSPDSEMIEDIDQSTSNIAEIIGTAIGSETPVGNKNVDNKLISPEDNLFEENKEKNGLKNVTEEIGTKSDEVENTVDEEMDLVEAQLKDDEDEEKKEEENFHKEKIDKVDKSDTKVDKDTTGDKSTSDDKTEEKEEKKEEIGAIVDEEVENKSGDKEKVDEDKVVKTDENEAKLTSSKNVEEKEERKEKDCDVEEKVEEESEKVSDEKKSTEEITEDSSKVEEEEKKEEMEEEKNGGEENVKKSEKTKDVEDEKEEEIIKEDDKEENEEKVEKELSKEDDNTVDEEMEQLPKVEAEKSLEDDVDTPDPPELKENVPSVDEKIEDDIKELLEENKTTPEIGKDDNVEEEKDELPELEDNTSAVKPLEEEEKMEDLETEENGSEEMKEEKSEEMSEAKVESENEQVEEVNDAKNDEKPPSLKEEIMIEKLSESEDTKEDDKEAKREDAPKLIEVEEKVKIEERKEEKLKKVEIRDEVKKEESQVEDAEVEEEESSLTKLSGRAMKTYSKKQTAAVDSEPESEGSEGADYRAWKKAVMVVYNRLATHKYASVFLRPITEDQAPGYHTVIFRPMDLSTIKKNIDNGTIRSTMHFQRDVMLMFQNAIMYNKHDTFVYKMAMSMQEECLQHMQILVQVTGEGPLRRETRTAASSSNESSESILKRKRSHITPSPHDSESPRLKKRRKSEND